MRRSASGSAATPALPRSATASAAAAMGAVGYFFEPRAVFFVTAVLLIPTLVALSQHPAGRSRSGPRAWRAGAAEDRAFAGRCAHRRSQAAAPHPRRLRLAVPSGQRRDAAADGQRADDALERMGDGADRGLHRGAAGRRRPDLALGRASRADLGPASVPAAGICRAGLPRAAVRAWSPIRICWSPCRCSTASRRRRSA